MFERFTTDARRGRRGGPGAGRGTRRPMGRHRAHAARGGRGRHGGRPGAGVARPDGRSGSRAGLDALARPSDGHCVHLGIDLDAVRRRAEEVFGPGALDQPFAEAPRRWWRRGRTTRPVPPTPSRARVGRDRGSAATARRPCELALREALRLDSREIRLEHVVLGLVRADGSATRLVSRLGIEPGDVRQAVLDLRRAA